MRVLPWGNDELQTIYLYSIVYRNTKHVAEIQMNYLFSHYITSVYRNYRIFKHRHQCILYSFDIVKFKYLLTLRYPCLSAQHYSGVMMGAMASRIASLTVVYSTVYSAADEKTHQSSVSLAFVRGIHRCRWIPSQRAGNAEKIPFDDVIMNKHGCSSLPGTLLHDDWLPNMKTFCNLIHMKRISITQNYTDVLIFFAIVKDMYMLKTTDTKYF